MERWGNREGQADLTEDWNQVNFLICFLHVILLFSLFAFLRNQGLHSQKQTKYEDVMHAMIAKDVISSKRNVRSFAQEIYIYPDLCVYCTCTVSIVMLDPIESINFYPEGRELVSIKNLDVWIWQADCRIHGRTKSTKDLLYARSLRCTSIIEFYFIKIVARKIYPPLHPLKRASQLSFFYR